MKNSRATKHEALLIIDLQNDFCPGGSLAVSEGDMILPLINEIASRFDIVVATKDWHPEGHVSFASRHGKAPFDNVDLGHGTQVLWPDHCIQGETGASLHPELDQRPLTMVLHKGVNRELDSYSAFLENDHTTPTGLEGYLHTHGISRVFICGLATDVCVKFSAMDAVHCGFETYVIEDACRGVNVPEGSVDSALHDMTEAGVRCIGSSELRHVLGP
ncbi:MAG: bifunctional nicotinamidase/pyrazinamidase [Spirochaetaceae bacterium]|nr:MAG: bifunctional nicotinamidase/pyrazinamidase [Spirochaetaceae bacterium]